MCAAGFENEHGFVGPGSGGEEGFVGLGIDEDVVEHVVIGRLLGGAVAHVEAGGEVDPVAVVLGTLELGVGGVLRGCAWPWRVCWWVTEQGAEWDE